MEFDELLTATIGFVLLATLLIGLALYFNHGFTLYTQNQVLEYYLWPVADAVPTGSGTYYLAVINTGQEPFTVKYIIYQGGSTQSVSTSTLYHNQYWLTTVSQPPAAVMVCSTIDPNVCVVAPVSNYTSITTITPCITTANIVVMSLSTSQEVWNVVHIYQGIYNNQPTTSYPSLTTINNNPYLLLTATYGSSGVMYWCASYTSGGTVTITLYGTYTVSAGVADGFYVEFFIQPNGWSISSQYNWSIPYITSTSNFKVVYNPGALWSGIIIFPYSNNPYLVVQWDPYFTYRSGLSGDWNVWVVSSSSSSGAYGYWWAGEGSGGFTPNAGDTLVMTVTYNPATNTVSGTLKDLNTGQVSSFSLSLNGYFTPPTSGQYIFGIGGATGGHYANWATNYVSFQG